MIRAWKQNKTLIRFAGTFGTLGLHEKSFLTTLLGFTPSLDYTPTNAYHAYSFGVYNSDNLFIINIRDKVPLKCDVFDGCIMDGLRQSISYSFLLDKPSG